MAEYVNNLTINSGEDFNYPLTILSSQGGDLDLTGYAVTSMMRKHPESSTVTAEFVVGITSAARGEVNLSLASTITSDIKQGRYVYDVLLTSDLNVRTIAVEGTALVRTGISS